MKEKELKELKLTKNIIIPFPNFQQNTIISPTQMNDNFEEIEHAYNTLIDNHNGALEKINKVLSDLTSSDNEAIVNEQERVKAEETRVQNEEERVANEEERKTEETKRIAMYNVHLNDEIRREQKHIQMVGEFDTKVGEVDTLISTKTEEYNSFVETKTEEYNTFVETKEVEIQDAINSIPPKSELIGEKGDKGDKGEKGDKGDRGEQGLQGIQGIQGLQGVKGDKGDKGEQGIQGLKGDKGDKGDRGEQGVKGDTPSITHLETSINNKIQEVETRFNALTSSQQQDAEVIDARDGEVSLKARLDRDIEKAKQVYVNVEGSHISTDSSSGYAKDVEILGNTIQSASNLADIRSVGEKVEGQELYEIPVLSNNSSIIVTNIHKDNVCISHTINDFTSSFELMNRGSFDVTVLIHKGEDWQRDVIAKPNKITKIELKDGERVYRIYFYKHSGWDLTKDYNFDSIVQANTKLEEDKLTILSPTPLEKVGDVRDRIIEKDGVLGVEKNIETILINNASSLILSGWNNSLVDTVRFDFGNNFLTTASKNLICDRFINIEVPSLAYDYEYISVNASGNLSFNVLKNKLTSIDLVGGKKYVVENPFSIKYATTQPQFIPLPHSQQVKLRTFANKTNISFLTEIEGTIKAQVPKSLGATVNTHTTQISNLNKELDRVKKLEESTVSTVTTESDFTTVEATSNGYFEDVKLEGKTLVNLANKDQRVTMATSTTFFFPGYIEKTIIKPSTKYVIVLHNISDKVTSVYFQYAKVTKTAISNNFAIFTTLDDLSSLPAKTRIHFYTNESCDVSEFSDVKYSLFECSDIMQNPPSYFEGLKSVGDGVDEIVVSSVYNKRNLIDLKTVNQDWGGGKFETDINSNNLNYHSCEAFDVSFLRNKQIYGGLFRDGVLYSSIMNFVCIFDENKQQIGDRFRITSSGYVVPSNAKYMRLMCYSGSGNTLEYINRDKYCISLIPFKDKEPYTPHQSDKKRLLFYNNETQTWEKPILREWDSIEKHANGKYYYHQRSGEVVLNGSENWIISEESFKENCYYFRFRKPASTSEYAIGGGKHICNMYKTLVNGRPDEPGIAIVQGNGLNDIEVIDLKTKFTSYDNALSKFKENISNSNIVIVYQLAKEKVYECTNIDLITYANETNYVVESGAIVPRTTLKVHNNISNVVNILQEKVSLLENKFIQGLKNVLAGDMYSLAELLYPEDFVSKEEPIDVPTLLI